MTNHAHTPQELRQLSNPSKRRKKVLFLGYDETETRLINCLIERECEVWHTQSPIKSTASYDFAVSFGYRHILKKEILESSDAPVINLHISYLPYNRGAHPNFWSFLDGTPSGVSIHLIDEGIDTGPILYQRYVNFLPSKNTFAKTYEVLIEEIQTLFEDHIDSIIDGNYQPKPQRHRGTYHSLIDLPENFLGWNSEIAAEIKRLDQSIGSKQQDKLKIIDEIERVRQANNINWMDLLRLAFTQSPIEAKKLVRRINADDNRISELFKKLGD
jgi:hypothetical protein